MSAGSETKICPQCHYERKPADPAPEWQCPDCGITFAGFGAATHEHAHKFSSEFQSGLPHDRVQHDAPSRLHEPTGAARWMLAAIALGACIWLGKPVWQAPGSASVAAVPGTAQPTVILYGTDWCPYCAQTRKFFAANGIKYIDLDIEKSRDAGQQYKKLGGTAVPVIVVGDRVFRGYSEESLRNALGPWMTGRNPPRSAPDVRVQLQAREYSARMDSPVCETGGYALTVANPFRYTNAYTLIWIDRQNIAFKSIAYYMQPRLLPFHLRTLQYVIA